MRQREPAICLRTSDFSETSQVVHFLTRGCGMVRLVAKGVKRPKSSAGGTLDMLCEGELVFIPSARESLGTLVEFTESVSHLPLRRKSSTLNAAVYMAELTGRLIAEGDVHAEVFDLLHNALIRLGQEGAPVPAVLAFFQWRLLRHVGLLGEFDACVSCGRAVSLRPRQASDAGVSPAPGVCFSSRQGGILCPGCEASAAELYPLDDSARAAIEILKAVETGVKVPLADAQATALNRLLAYHAQQQIGKPLRMARHAIG